MSSLGISLPLTLDDAGGFTRIKTFNRLVKQNLKMLILTIPGERVMIPEYGVGLKKYLFSNYNPSIFGEIQQKISEQVAIYLPAVTIKDIQFNDSSPDQSLLSIRIVYSVPQLGIQDYMQVTI